MEKIKVGILGATGMVGQRFITLLQNHPWFDINILAASPASAGKTYGEAVAGRWKLDKPTPTSIKNIRLCEVVGDLNDYANKVQLVFSALDMEKEEIRKIEEALAQKGVVVVSNNSAHRWSKDVPIIIPEINSDHLVLINIQRQKRDWPGFIIVKPNCSLQSYLPVIYALKKFQPVKVSVITLQAISGAGKTFTDFPEIVDNVIPFINGEEEKTEKEPLKVLGKVENGEIKLANSPVISATCIRVPVSDGHMAAVTVKFSQKPTLEQIKEALKNFAPLKKLGLPSAPKEFVHYFVEDNRPQTKLDRDYENGMGITCGRFKEDPHFDWKFIVLSHNTIRGAAGGAILTAELLKIKGYL